MTIDEFLVCDDGTATDRWMTDLLMTRDSLLRLDTVDLDSERGEPYAGRDPR